MRRCVLALLAACGRIHFDPLGIADDGGGDAQVNACGERVLGMTAVRSAPRMAWSGSNYLVAWGDSTTFNTIRVDENGDPLAPTVPITSEIAANAGNFPHVNVIWTTAEWGLVWQTGSIGEIVFARVAADGTEIGTEAQLTNTPTQPSQQPGGAYSGTLYAVTWVENAGPSPDVMLAMLDAQGLRQATDVSLSGAGTPLRSGAAVLFDATGFIFVWGETNIGRQSVLFRKATAAGVPLGTPLEIHMDAGNAAPTIDAALAGTLVGITRAVSGSAIFLLTDTAGAVMVERVLSTGTLTARPAIAWNGQSFGIAWIESETVLFQEFDVSAAPIGNRVALTTLGSIDHGLGIAFDGNRDYAIVWGTQTHELRFVRVCR